MPLDEWALKCLRKIANSKIFEILLGIIGYAIICAIGGALLAVFQDGDIRVYMCGGALFGVAYYFIGLLYNHLADRD